MNKKEQQNYRENHKEEIKRNNKKWYLKNKENCKKYKEKYDKEHVKENKKYRQKHREKISQRHKKWRKGHRWMESYYSAKYRCENKNNKDYERYGGRGINFLITIEEVKKLWFRDKAYLMKKPSIDRENNDGNYEFSNCRFIELVENSAKDKRKPINQYDLDGNFIRSWKSQTQAQKELGFLNSHISEACLGKYKQSCGFIWRFKN